MTRKAYLKKGLTFLAFVALFAGCANEPSEEAKRRELSDREYTRLEKAAGTYAGYMDGPSGKAVPTSIKVTVRKNPTATAGEKPILLVVLRIGLFGGVRIASSSALFDWGTKGLSATFAPGKADADKADGGSARLEFRATVVDGDLVKPALFGAHQGSHPLFLKKTSEETLQPDQEFRFLLYVPKGDGGYEPKNRAMLTLKTRKEPEAAPADADLPLFPGLEASVYFEGFAGTPQVASLILYDPIKATLELQFSKASWMKLTDVYVNVDELSINMPQEMPGKVTVGGFNFKDVLLRQAPSLVAPQKLPPAVFLGTFQGAPDTLKYKAVGYLHFKESASNNTPDLPFLSFPDMRFEIVVCLGDEPFQKSFHKLVSVDFLNLKGLFRRENDSADSPLRVTWSKNLDTVDGIFATTDGGESEAGRPRIKFQARPEIGFKGCAEPL